MGIKALDPLPSGKDLWIITPDGKLKAPTDVVESNDNSAHDSGCTCKMRSNLPPYWACTYKSSCGVAPCVIGWECGAGRCKDHV